MFNTMKNCVEDLLLRQKNPKEASTREESCDGLYKCRLLMRYGKKMPLLFTGVIQSIMKIS
jgi:hypothetical protein